MVRGGAPDPAGHDLVVNATPAGMLPHAAPPVDLARLDPAAYVGDLITRPVITPLLATARSIGCPIVTGEDMFAVQAGIMADILLAPPAFFLPACGERVGVRGGTKPGCRDCARCGAGPRPVRRRLLIALRKREKQCRFVIS